MLSILSDEASLERESFSEPPVLLPWGKFMPWLVPELSGATSKTFTKKIPHPWSQVTGEEPFNNSSNPPSLCQTLS